VITVCFHPEALRPHLPELVKALMPWGEDSKNHFRVKIKVILERLIRKHG
jgi:ribosomal RNA-processing protein 12